MIDETPDGPSGPEGERLDQESGVGAGDPSITSTEKPAEPIPDDPPDHKSGLETQEGTTTDDDIVSGS